MVDYCFNHIRCTNLGDVHLSNVQLHLISFPSPENSSERPLLRKTEPHALPGNAVEIFKKPGNSEEKILIFNWPFSGASARQVVFPFWILVYKIDTKKNNGVLFYHQFHHENIVILEYIYVEHCRTTVLPQYWINRCRPCNKEEVSPLFHPFSDSDHYHQNVNVWGPLSCIPFSHVYGELREVPRTYPQTSWQTWPGRSPAHLVRGFPS